jgi:hypothetical protein
MTNAAGLDANAYLPLTRRSDGPLYEVKSPGFRYFDRPIRFSHLRLLSMCRDCLVFVHRNFEEAIVWITHACCRKGKPRAILKRLKRWNLCWGVILNFQENP